jgi:hypothetical protein
MLHPSPALGRYRQPDGREKCQDAPVTSPAHTGDSYHDKRGWPLTEEERDVISHAAYGALVTTVASHLSAATAAITPDEQADFAWTDVSGTAPPRAENDADAMLEAVGNWSEAHGFAEVFGLVMRLASCDAMYANGVSVEDVTAFAAFMPPPEDDERSGD